MSGTLYDEDGNGYTGTLTDEQVAAIARKTLRNHRTYAVSIDEGIENYGFTVPLSSVDMAQPTVALATVGSRIVEVAAPESLGPATGGGVRWRVRVPGIRGWELGLSVEVTGDADGRFEVNASGLAYARAMLGVESYASSGHDAMCALVAYHDAQVAYGANN